MAAQLALADLPLDAILSEAVVPYEADEISRLIMDTHDAEAFRLIAGLTIGRFRDWLLLYQRPPRRSRSWLRASRRRWPPGSPSSWVCRTSSSWRGSAGW